jgi:hypothetical protein
MTYNLSEIDFSFLMTPVFEGTVVVVVRRRGCISHTL